jgi:hypothetical protein
VSAQVIEKIDLLRPGKEGGPFKSWQNAHALKSLHQENVMAISEDKNPVDGNWADYFDNLVYEAWLESRTKRFLAIKPDSRTKPELTPSERLTEPQH